MRLNLIISIFCLLISNSYAQQSVPVSGGSLNGTGGNVVFTVGQMNYGNITDKNSISAVGGIQQPIEIEQMVKVDPSFNISLKCSISPNPTSDFINLKVDDEKYKELSFELVDINGKILINMPNLYYSLPELHQIIKLPIGVSAVISKWGLSPNGLKTQDNTIQLDINGKKGTTTPVNENGKVN